MSQIFEDQLGYIEGVKAKLHLKPDVQPKFLRARNLPFALREKVESELERLVEAGVITPVQHAEWATPIVPVMKQNGTVRICGDYKTAINQSTITESYPLPRIDGLLSSLAGGKAFTKMDLAHAYMQVPLEDESKSLTTINAHKGLYQYNRLPFGISSAPAIFQPTMETILRDIPQVFVYIDDILVTGGTERALTEPGCCVKTPQGEGYPTKAGEVLFYATRGRILGTCTIIKWYTTISQEFESYPVGTSSRKCHTVKILFRNGNVLFKIFA